MRAHERPVLHCSLERGKSDQGGRRFRHVSAELGIEKHLKSSLQQRFGHSRLCGQVPGDNDEQ